MNEDILKKEYNGKNIEGDDVHIVWHKDGYFIDFNNNEDGYAGATILPHEFIESLLEAQKKKDAEIARNCIQCDCCHHTAGELIANDILNQ